MEKRFEKKRLKRKEGRYEPYNVGGLLSIRNIPGITKMRELADLTSAGALDISGNVNLISLKGLDIPSGCLHQKML